MHKFNVVSQNITTLDIEWTWKDMFIDESILTKLVDSNYLTISKYLVLIELS